MGNLRADIRFAFRALRRSPLFATVAILSLALGIGANTAIFTLVDQIVLRRLPIERPEELVMLYQEGAHNGSNMGARMHSYPLYRDFQTRAEPLAEVLCRRMISTSLSDGGQTERVSAEMVSGNYFSLLGVKPAAGRVFSSREDDRVYRGHPVVVLSHDYWLARFGGDRAVVGRKILVNNYPMTIVGVSAAGFAGLDPTRSPQIRVPVLMMPILVPEWTWVKIEDRRTRWIQVFARLKPGQTPASAEGPLRGLFRQIREYEATLPAAAQWSPFAKAEFLKGTLHVEKAQTGYSPLRNDFSKALLVLMAMVGLVLLIACANVANLLIARSVARQKEIAVRLSIGATRGQLVRQLLTESVILAGLGGVAGIVLAVAMTRGLLALVPADGNPLLVRPEPDLRILFFTLAVTLVTGVLFGLLPALRASRPDLAPTLKDNAGSIVGHSSSLYLRKGLVTAQVSLSFLLLFGAGLFLRSLDNLKAKETGFERMDNLITFQLTPAQNGYSDERADNFYNELLDRLRASPGVRSAALATVPLLAGDEWDSTISVEGHTAADGENMQAFMNMLSPGYFQTMGVALLEGRDFDRRDEAETAKTAMVNRRFAEHYFPGRSAIGRRIGFGGAPGTKLDIEIVGVVEDTLYEGPREGVRRQVFRPRQGNMGVAAYVRSTQASAAAFAAVRGEVRKLDASLPVFQVKTLAGQLDETLLTERLIALLSAAFGMLATLLAAIGVYGVMAFAVAGRRREMGIRLALGAPPGTVLWMILREVLVLVSIGLLVGVPAALGLGRLVANQLYGVEAHNPAIATVTVLILALVGAFAGWIPARRASRIDPVLALRYE
jgi:predicted permease